MKRIRNLCILALLTIVISLILSGYKNRIDKNELQLICSYELVAAKVESQTQVSEQLSGTYLFCLGSISGNIETTTTPVYKYWYKRQDGGIISTTIDMSSYHYPKNVSIVVYEDDSTTPKVEIWRNHYAQAYGDGEFCYDYAITEFRFTIPSGSFVNTYDLQGLTENSH